MLLTTVIMRVALVAPSSRPPIERLFVYLGKNAKGTPGVIQGLWLPSGRRFTVEGRSGEAALLRVSPDGRSVAFYTSGKIDSRSGIEDPALWVVDVPARTRKRLALLFTKPERLEWVDERRLFMVRNGDLSTLERGGRGWSWVGDWPGGASSRRRATLLARLQSELNRKEPGLNHDAVWLSSDGRTLAAFAGRGGGTLEAPDPHIRTGDVRRSLAAYDVRTLRRRFEGPTWDQFQSDPPDYAFAGWVGKRMAVVGPSKRNPGVQALILYGSQSRQEFALPGLTGYGWSMAGNPGLDPLRGLDATRSSAP